MNFLSAQRLPSIELEDIHEQSVSIEELRGESLTVIDFWATWCKPCTKAMPYLEDIYQDYKDSGVQFVGISCDGPRSISRVPSVVESLGVNYSILKDISCQLKGELDFPAFPTLIIVDSNLEILWVHEGFATGDETLIADKIKELLGS